ncbi:MAG: hypothetical protein ACYTEK_25010, partial [Planctomycetota bacterium]
EAQSSRDVFCARFLPFSREFPEKYVVTTIGECGQPSHGQATGLRMDLDDLSSFLQYTDLKSRERRNLFGRPHY